MPINRSSAVSATYTAIALVFCFGVGLAGGAAYKVFWADAPAPQLAARVAPPPAPPPLTVAAQPPASPSALAAQLAAIQPTAPPSIPPPAAATDAPASPDADADAADAFSPPDLPQVSPSAPEATPYTAMTPAPPSADTHTAKHRRTAAATPAKKPQLAAKSARPSAEQTAALHAPPTAPGNQAGPYRIQFGAFANEDNARRMQWAIEATGLKVEVSEASGASGHSLYYLRSPGYHDYAAALSAAQTVQDRVQHFVNPIAVDYAILGDHSAIEQQADAH